MTSKGDVEVDESDSSVTRPERLLREIFDRAGLHVCKDFLQQKFPRELYPVKMFALIPKSRVKESEDGSENPESENN